MGLRLFDRFDVEGHSPDWVCDLSRAIHDSIWSDKSQSICSRAWWLKKSPCWAWWVEQLGPLHCEASFKRYHAFQHHSSLTKDKL